MAENKKIAAEMVAREIKEFCKFLREQKFGVAVVSYEDQSDWPDGDGEGTFSPMTIGTRGGYNEDPREIWDIPEAARYVRWWAHFAGMNDPGIVERYVLDAPDDRLAMLNDNPMAAMNIALLAACGVFGDEMKAIVLRNLKPSNIPQ
jgi:hypothetical protein